jgi:hypothetical protein
VAPPLVNAAPAPPATGSGQKQEEREAATERAEMTALDPARRLGYETGIAVTGLLIITAAALAVAVRPRPRPRAAPVITRRNEE